MTNEFKFHYQGFRALYQARLENDWYHVYYNDKYVTAFPKDEMKDMIDNKRVRIVGEENEAA